MEQTRVAAIQLSLPMPEAAPAPCVQDRAPSLHEQLGFELGWDHARYGSVPPVDQLFQQSPLRQGWQAGRASFGRRTLRASPHVRQWLALRCHAWLRGRSFETLLVTPNYLQQLEASHCPITRQPLQEQAGTQQRRIDRVRDDAGYAAGNLVQMSQQANQAKGDRDFAALQALALSLRQGPLQQAGGLDLASWDRLVTLASFVTELPHEQAARLPLRVLPPNRLRLFNPIQALQALLTRQLATPGWSQRLTRIESLLGSDPLRADFSRFVLALAPRVLRSRELLQREQIRWALEDAWQDALVLKRWTQFALNLGATQAEALVHKAAAKKLSPVHVERHAHPTEGWALERQGFRAAA